MSESLRFSNSYHNEATPPKPTERPEMSAFYAAADRVLSLAAELARVVTQAHQGAATVLINGDWSQGRKYFSLSDKYAQWADYATPATGYGIHGYIAKMNLPFRMTQAELEAHPEWKNFGTEDGKHPPMRGWLALPLIGADGLNYGFVQVSDRYEGEFSDEDQTHLARLVEMTATALDSLAQLHLPDYRAKIAEMHSKTND
jgi:GAF domain-containing protein